jgi:predicted RNA-binding Zn ribbon-like protein
VDEERVHVGLPLVLGTVVAAVYDAMHDGTWSRMKACRNDGCRWAFYDHSRNRSGAWCQMETCGTQAKMRTYRQRRAQRA